MADLLSAIASAVGDLFTTVETTVVATQTLATSTTDAGTLQPTTTTSQASIDPTSATSQQSQQTEAAVSAPTTDGTQTSPQTTSQALPVPLITSTTSGTSSSSSTSVTASASASIHVTDLATQPASSGTFTAALQSATTSTAPTDASLNASSSQTDHRPAIIGGLVGAIVALIAIALIVFFLCLRKRRRRRDTDVLEQFHYEPPAAHQYQPHPDSFRHQTGMREVGFGFAAPLARPEPVTMKSFKSANGTLINMSLDHFTRPFGEQEGYRDLVQPGMLRVTNPDRSLPVTPNLAAERLSDPFNRAKPFVPSTIHEKEISVSSEQTGTSKLPIVRVDEVPSTEGMALDDHGQQYAPSFRSYPSIHTSSPRASRWLTESLPPVPSLPDRQRPKRPTLSPLHSVASRTLSSIGNVLRLSSGKPGETLAVEHDTNKAASRHVSTASDQFDLDSPQARSGTQSWQRWSNGRQKPLTTYEGC